MPDPLSTSPVPKTRAASTLIFLIVFLDLLGVGLIAPLTPYITEKFDKSAQAVALLTLAYSAAQFFATPVLGALSDRVGRRPVLIVSLIGSSLGYVMFALAGAMWLLVLSRIIDGFTGGNISTAQAYIADITPPKDRAKSYGLVGAAFGLGFTLGPAFGALLTPLSPVAPIWAAAGLALVTCSLVYFLLPETVTADTRTRGPFRATELNPLAALLRVLVMAGLPALLAIIFLMSVAQAETRTSFGILLRDKFGMPEQHASWMFAFLGLLAVLVQGVLVRRISPRLGDRRTALVGLPIGIAGYMLLPFASSTPALLGAIGLMGLGMGLAGPTVTGIISRSVDPRHQGAVMGASQAASSLALVAGPIAAGLLYDHVGWGWPFWTAGGFVAIAFLVLIAIRPTLARVIAPVAAGPAI